MARWVKQIRIVLIAAAAFVLLVTVLPQVAAGIGLGSLAHRLDVTTNCSGSSGSSGSGSSDSSGSSGCATGPGTVSGMVTVTGAPSGFAPALIGAGACPYVSAGQSLCAFPQFALALGGNYSLQLAPGNWVVEGFYENTALGGAFVGPPHMVTVASGANLSVNVRVRYAVPATLHVTVTVSGLAPTSPVLSSYAILCPQGVHYDGIVQPLACVRGDSSLYPPSPTPGSFSIVGLPAGRWKAYPGYCTLFGCADNPQAGKHVTTVAGQTSQVDLSTGFLVPPNGQLTASASVTGAPVGFNNPVGIMACDIGHQFGFCSGTFNGGGGPTTMILPDGIWAVSAFYTVQPFGNAVSGQVQNIVIQGGQVTTLDLVVPYQVLGTATGSITITGKPASVPIKSYSVYACPVGLSNPFSYLSCVSEYSGVAGYAYGAADPKRFGQSARRGSLSKPTGATINTYNLPTLTPGQWNIQVTYSTPFGYYSPQFGTIVNITAGKTTATKIKIPYQQPYSGIVKGTLTVVGIGGGFNSQVRACSSAPVAGICNGGFYAQMGSNGTYQLQLPPGTWWVQGVVYVYSGFNSRTLTSEAKQVTVVGGSSAKANFTVTGP